MKRFLQVRIAFEPLVQPAARFASLEPLAACSNVQCLALHDALFARRPWFLADVAPLRQLRELELRYDTALWARGALLGFAAAFVLSWRVCRLRWTEQRCMDAWGRADL